MRCENRAYDCVASMRVHIAYTYTTSGVLQTADIVDPQFFCLLPVNDDKDPPFSQKRRLFSDLGS